MPECDTEHGSTPLNPHNSRNVVKNRLTFGKISLTFVIAVPKSGAKCSQPPTAVGAGSKVFGSFHPQTGRITAGYNCLNLVVVDCGCDRIPFQGSVLTTPLDNDRPLHIAALDGWRGLAVSLVVFGHFGLDARFPWFSSLGVDLFFALSGRLMAEILFLRRMPLPVFFARRFVRIYPTLVVYVLVAMAVTGGTVLSFSPQAAILALTFTVNYAVAVYGYGLPALDHTWSLCVEEHSYVLLAVIALACRTLSTRTAGYVILALGLAAIANGSIQLDVFHRRDIAVLWRTDTAMAGLFVAAGLRILLGGKVFAPAWVWLVPVAMLCAVVARAFGGDAFVYFGLKGLFLAVAVSGLEQGWAPLRAVFETRTLGFLGQCSFSIYLWQQLFSKMAALQILPPLLLMATGVAVGIVAYYAIERPARAACGALVARLFARLTVIQPSVG